MKRQSTIQQLTAKQRYEAAKRREAAMTKEEKEAERLANIPRIPFSPVSKPYGRF